MVLLYGGWYGKTIPTSVWSYHTEVTPKNIPHTEFPGHRLGFFKPGTLGTLKEEHEGLMSLFHSFTWIRHKMQLGFITLQKLHRSMSDMMLSLNVCQ